MATIRERLLALAEPLGITLPEAYLAYLENPPAQGIFIRHLCDPRGDPKEWWPETIKGLEASWGEPHELYAHYVRATGEQYGGNDANISADDSEFRASRLLSSFFIGEVDGDSVFLDGQTLGVFAHLTENGRVEKWADSFAAFVEHGQQYGEFVNRFREAGSVGG
jgi:hypothetical protein